jgi:hypothetical protein
LHQLLPAPGGGKQLKAHVQKYKTDVAGLIASFASVGVGADVASAVHAACSTSAFLTLTGVSAAAAALIVRGMRQWMPKPLAASNRIHCT